MGRQEEAVKLMDEYAAKEADFGRQPSSFSYFISNVERVVIGSQRLILRWKSAGAGDSHFRYSEITSSDSRLIL